MPSYAEKGEMALEGEMQEGAEQRGEGIEES
jgi:hypothetical protein